MSCTEIELKALKANELIAKAVSLVENAQKMADGMATAQLLAAYEQWETQSEEKSQERLEQELERMYDEVREKVLQEIEEDAEKGE